MPMQTAVEYRKEANGYVRQPENTPAVRRLKLPEIAHSWLRLADQIEFLESNPPTNGHAGPYKYTRL